jgi:glycosyltransferase involved in cell wall biosynthesis
MKALFLRTDFYGHITVGGSFSHTRGFLEGLAKAGHEYAAISSGPLPLPQDARFYVVPYSALFRNLPEVLSIAYNWRLIHRAGDIFQRERPDFIYHRHSEFNYSSAVLAKRHRIPLVLECNGSEVWIKKHWGNVYLESLLQMAETVQFTTADLITVVSSVMKADLVALGVPGDKILVNPNGVDPELFRPEALVPDRVRTLKEAGSVVVGFVGTFGAWHGVDVLARSVKHVIRQNPRIRFLLIGDGVLRAEVERILRDDGMSDYVHLLGSLAHDVIPGYLAGCDILLSPHVHNTDGTPFFGSPTKLFEYMAMGKPIIASGVGQIAEVLHDNVNAVLMKHRDHEDLAQKILTLAADPDFGRKLGAAARRDAVTKFSWQSNAQRVVDAVQSLPRVRR